MKRAFILLELTIALGLTAILLAVLFRFFAASVRMDQKIDRAKAELYARQHFQLRVGALLTSVVPKSSLPSSAGASFYTDLQEKEPCLIALFDNGVDPDPDFSGTILGKLFVDEKANLVLALWPTGSSDRVRTEVLLPRVHNVGFQFLAKKSLEPPNGTTVSLSDGAEWRADWPPTRWDLPSLVRIELLQDHVPLQFAFLLPVLEPVPVYQEVRP